jgi:putative pyruvate formate lyase activating enzyme
MTCGVIVRHLVLPGQTEDSKQILSYLHREYGDAIYISIMRQYTPMAGMTGDLARPLTEAEYDDVVNFALRIGIQNAFLQEGEAVGESFIPAFNGEGVR